MRNFSELGISPGVRVNPTTGEIIEVIEQENNTGIVRPGSFNPPIYTQESIDCARQVTSELCEKIIARITQGKRVKRGNNRGHDIITKTGEKVEAKVGRIGNSAVVKQNQLFEFDASFWGFIFYRTLNNLPPSFYTSQKKNISPTANLKRSISIQAAYILPTEVMRYYWNTAAVKKGIISTSGIAHRPFTVSRAEGLVHDENVPGRRTEKTFQYGKHDFPVRSIDFNL